MISNILQETFFYCLIEKIEKSQSKFQGNKYLKHFVKNIINFQQIILFRIIH